MNPDFERFKRLVAREDFHHFPGSPVVVCLLSMKNGTQLVTNHITGPEVFDLKAAKDRARDKAYGRLRGLEAYRQRAERAAGDPCSDPGFYDAKAKLRADNPGADAIELAEGTATIIHGDHVARVDL